MAKSSGFSPLEGRVYLRLRGPPDIWHSMDVVMAREGETTALRCDANSVPHPISVTWSRNGVTITEGEFI